jgi:hypothetical protein
VTMTATRVAIQNALQTAFGINFVGGKINGPVERGDVGCVFPIGKREVSGDVSLENPLFQVRVLSAVRRRRGAKDPKDPAKLEGWAELIQTTLGNAAALTFGPWYVRVQEVSIDVDLGQVDAIVIGWQANVFKSN